MTSENTALPDQGDASAPNVAERGYSPSDLIRPVGLHKSSTGIRSLVVALTGSSATPPLRVPLAALGASRSAQVQELMLKNGFVEVAAAFSPKELSSALMTFATSSNAHVIDREGAQELEVSGMTYRVFVKGGQCYWLDRQPPGVNVVLIGKAAVKNESNKTLDQFNAELAPLLAMSPRWLMVVLVALAAMLFKLFGVRPLSLGLIGPSCIGKSIIQQSVSYLVNGNSDVKTFNATENGLHDFLRAQSARAVFLEDAHGGDAAAALFRAVMDVGNGGGRMRSSHGFDGEDPKAVECVLIVSAERDLMETARAGGYPPTSGIFARILELFPAQHGMFESLGTFDSSAGLVRHIKEASPDFAGVVGDAVVKLVATDFTKTVALWQERRVMLRKIVMKSAGIQSVDGVNDRLLESLAFCAFVGHVSISKKVLAIKRQDLNRAVGGLFKEHIERLNSTRTPVAQAAIEAVRHFILTNPARFLPLVQAGDPNKPNQLAGYVKRGEPGNLYLFFPGTFNEKFVDVFGSEVYDHLRAAGFLAQQKGRHNRYLARVPAHGLSGEDSPRLNFVAIRERILFESAD